MAIQELNQNEVENVAGALSLGIGTSALVLDLNSLLDGVQGALNGLLDGGVQPVVNGLIDGLQGQLGGLLGGLPTFPVLTVPVLGLSIALSIG